jgi:hypothetical protein
MMTTDPICPPENMSGILISLVAWSCSLRWLVRRLTKQDAHPHMPNFPSFSSSRNDAKMALCCRTFSYQDLNRVERTRS